MEEENGDHQGWDCGDRARSVRTSPSEEGPGGVEASERGACEGDLASSCWPEKRLGRV